jgi:hypothetical protein
MMLILVFGASSSQTTRKIKSNCTTSTFPQLAYQVSRRAGFIVVTEARVN